MHYNYFELERTEHVASFMKEVLGKSEYYHHLHGGSDKQGIFVKGKDLAGDRGEFYINACSQKDGRKRNEKYSVRNEGEELRYDYEMQYPQNLKLSTCSYYLVESAKVNKMKEIIMLQIRIDYAYKRGRKYPVEADMVIDHFTKEIVEQHIIPTPTYYIRDYKFSLLYVFENPIIVAF